MFEFSLGLPTRGLGFLCCLAVLAPAPVLAQSPFEQASRSNRAVDSSNTLGRDFPGVMLLRERGLVVAAYGRPMTTATTAELAASDWLARYADVFGIVDLDLTPKNVRRVRGGDMTLLSYAQRIAGVAVESARVRVVVRADRDRHTVTFVSARLSRLPKEAVAPELIGSLDAERIARALPECASCDEWSQPELIIARRLTSPRANDVDDARRCWRLRARGSNATELLAWCICIDAASGDVFELRDESFHFDASGTVSGYATTNSLPDEWSVPMDGPQSVMLPYVRVNVVGDPGAFAFSDALGAYELTSPNPITDVEASLSGRYVDVESGTSTDIIAQAPASIGQLLFNDSPIADQTTATAQVNGYYWANRVIDFIIGHEPSTDSDFVNAGLLVRVEAASGGCGGLGNFASGSPSVVQTFNAGAGACGACPNCAYSTPICHETGHFVAWLLCDVQLGQGTSFGEGLADTIANFVVRTPLIAESHYCTGDYMRDADNTIQYPFAGAMGSNCCGTFSSPDMYSFGQLLSGIWWSVKSKLEIADPMDGEMIAGELLTQWILTTIAGDPQFATTIAVEPLALAEVLAVDTDDDLYLGNGTDHSDQIIDGFDDHGITIPLPQAPFIRGDFTADGLLQIGDSTELFGYLFGSGPAPSPCDRADVDDDGVINIGDGVLLLNFLFSSGSPPEYPYPNPGLDVTPIAGC